MRGVVRGLAFLVATAGVCRFSAAGPVDIDPAASLTADVSSILGDGGASGAANGATRTAHDDGSLSKPDASTSAAASVPGDGGDFTGSGSAGVHLTSSSNGFTLSGTSAAGLTGASSLTADVRSVGMIDLPFVVAADFSADPHLSIAINAEVARDEKVTIVLDRSGDSQSIISQVFDENFDGALNSIGAGSYRLQLITGALATAKGVAGEQGSAGFQLSFDATRTTPAAVPLPAGAWLGIGGLALAAIVVKTRGRASVNII